MNESCFLSYVVDPFDALEPMFVICDELAECREVSAAGLSACQTPVVTFHVPTLVDAVRLLGSPLPRSVVEIRDGLRLRSGLSRDQGGEAHWNVWAALKAHFERAGDLASVRDAFEAKVRFPERAELFRLLSASSRALRQLWLELSTDLVWRKEQRRFLEIEIPVQQVFLARQYAGIEIDVDFAERCRLEAQDCKYRAFREVGSILNVSPTGLNFRTVGQFLARTDARHLAEWADYPNLRDYFEIAQGTSKFASAFLRFVDASDDLTLLTLIAAGTRRSFPTFECFGTVTGRILATSPRLQQLPKRFRRILAPDAGKKLLYLDYAQFEPAILAAAANDAGLRTLYETEDLYRALSVAVFGRRDERELCKKIFLAYCYGMSVENIARLLAGSEFSLEKLTECANSVRGFFDAFPTLETYRQRAQDRLLEDGYVSTVLGNRRVRQTEGPLTAKERRWAANQYIQGTASVIFKQAIIDIAKHFGSDSVLLPMHDAVLLQYDPAGVSREEFERETVNLMTAAFEKWSPGVHPKIVSSDFAGAPA